MRKTILFLFLTGIINILFAQENETRIQSFQKPTDKDQRQVVNVNELQLTVTNYGVLGARNAFWPIQFSAEYPRGSRIEHLYQGGIFLVLFQEFEVGLVYLRAVQTGLEAVFQALITNFHLNPVHKLLKGQPILLPVIQLKGQ